MFTKRTVFIVGAGASQEVGLPTGDTLKQAIAQRVNISYENSYNQTKGDKKIAAGIIQRFQDEHPNPVNDYFAAGRAISDAMPHAASIDNFLHTHADDPHLVFMGKVGIAASIIEAERTSTIYCQRHERPNFSSINESWHAVFMKMLMEGSERTKSDQLFENLTIITFNYDRCIEHFLGHALPNYLRYEPEQAIACLKSLRIYHPYGQVGGLPWLDDARMGLDFGAEISAKRLIELQDNIRTFTERMEDELVLEEMRNSIAEAEIIVCLGFSFGRMNMDLLDTNRDGPVKHVFGTSYGMSDPNKRVVEHSIVNSWAQGYERHIAIDFAPVKCKNLLYDFGRLIAE